MSKINKGDWVKWEGGHVTMCEVIGIENDPHGQPSYYTIRCGTRAHQSRHVGIREVGARWIQRLTPGVLVEVIGPGDRYEISAMHQALTGKVGLYIGNGNVIIEGRTYGKLWPERVKEVNNAE